MSQPSPSRTSRTIGGFTLIDASPGLAPNEVEALGGGWVPALVPGGVHESLLAVGRIEHPYRDRHEDDIRWMEDRDWWYRTTFDADAVTAPGERAELVFHGLDTVVDLWLNGEPLGHHENMFREARFDVGARLRGTNELLLRFSPPLAGLSVPSSVAEMNERLAAVFAGLAADSGESAPDAPAIDPTTVEASPADESVTLPDNLALSTLRRKATFSWGWDFGPRVPSIGIWLPVELERTVGARIAGHHVRTVSIDADGTANVAVLVEAERVGAGSAAALVADVTLVSPDGRRFTAQLPVDFDGTAFGHGTADLTIPDAALWWTHDLGTPALHDVTIVLREATPSGDPADAVALDSVTDRVGLRTIAIDRSDDPEGGRFFRFLLNGTPIFARGAAWLPPDMMVGSVTDERLHGLVTLARDGNMNMLRVWGGGIYEHDAFYRATDELGVLIWHDFMFACTDYPSLDEGLQNEVRLEAEFQVKRLRNRASMGLWSGNNEVHLIHGFAYQNYEPGDWGYDFFHRILPEAVSAFDGGTPYWPGSPWGDDTAEGFMAVNGVLDGDRHAWEVWHGFDFGAGGGPYDSIGEARHYRRYANDKGKFISEFGIHASPVLSTLEKWIDAADLTVHSDAFDAHNKDTPKNKGDALMEIITGIPETMPEYVDFTMVSQAEGLKFGIEHYRRRQPHCNGALVWQFNDVWPGFSWSVLDYETVPKAGYYATSRAFAPVLASFAETTAAEGAVRLELWLSNSGATAVSTSAVVTLEAFGGQSAHPAFEAVVSATVEPASSTLVWSAPLDELPGMGDQDARSALFAWVDSPDGAFAPNRHFFAEVKDLALPEARLVSTVERVGDEAADVTITAEGYAYLVRVTAPSATTARFSENYVDLRDGDTATVRVTGLPAGFATSELVVGGYAGVPSRV